MGVPSVGGVRQLAKYPGVDYVRRCTYTRTLGTYPDAAVMEIQPQAGVITECGELRFTFGSNTVRLPNCRVDWGSLQFNSRGQMVSLRILDRRWAWKFGIVTGQYNRRHVNGAVNEDTRKTPQQLAAILLRAMGESGYHVGDLPNTGYPEQDWVCANPANQLSQLCEEYGCRVCLKVDTNSVRIVRVGFGSIPLVNSETTSINYGVSSPASPSAITLCGAPVRVQAFMQLEAIAEEQNGEVKRMRTPSASENPEPLSYKEALGDAEWVKQDPMVFGGVPDPKKQVAKQTAYRKYRIIGFHNGTLDNPSLRIPGWPSPQNNVLRNIDQILPVSNDLIETTVDAALLPEPRKAYIVGLFSETPFVAVGDPRLPEAGNHVTLTRWPGHFHLDRGQGIVTFPQHTPAYLHNSLGSDKSSYDEAKLWLLTSFNVRLPTTNSLARYELSKPVGGPNAAHQPCPTQPLGIRRDDLEWQIINTYDTEGQSSPSHDDVSNNLPEINLEANASIDAAMREFADVTSRVVTYRGILLYESDGARRQITWSVDLERGAFTTIHYNSETAKGIARYRERRRAEAFFEQRNRVRALQVRNARQDAMRDE